MSGGDPVPAATGMSLRDWFAGQALMSVMSNDSWNNYLIENAGEFGIEISDAASKLCYLYADAMLKARGK